MMHDGMIRTLDDSNGFKFLNRDGFLRVGKGSSVVKRKDGEYPLYHSASTKGKAVNILYVIQSSTMTRHRQ